MRILNLTFSLEETGGAERLAVDQARWFREQGLDSGLLTFRLDASRWNGALEGLDVQVLGTGGPLELLSLSDPGRKLALRARRAAPHFRRADVVIGTNFPAGAMLGTWRGSQGGAARSSGPLTIGYCHEPPRRLNLRDANPHLAAALATDSPCRAVADLGHCLERQRSRHDRLRERDQAAVRELDLLVGSSEFSAALLERVYGRAVDAILPPMVRLPEAYGPRRAPNRDALQILFHSRLLPPKNADTLLRALRLLHERGLQGAVVHVVGEGPEAPFLEQLVGELGLASSVQFHGFLPREELEQLYERCDVLAVPTLDEPFGMVFVEAIGRGLLIVGPNHGGPSEILGQGELGWTVDPFDPEALAGALEEVAAMDGTSAERRREAALRSCRARFDRDFVGQRWLEFLNTARAGLGVPAAGSVRS